MKKEDFLLIIAVIAIILSGFALGLGFFTNWQVKSLLTGYTSFSDNVDIVFHNSTFKEVKEKVFYKISESLLRG